EFQHAWIEPGRIERLKGKPRKISGVYRLHGIGPGGAAIIAKRCRVATARVEQMIYTRLLPHVPVPALECYGFLEEPGSGYCWMSAKVHAGVCHWAASAAAVRGSAAAHARGPPGNKTPPRGGTKGGATVGVLVGDDAGWGAPEDNLFKYNTNRKSTLLTPSPEW